MLHTRLADYTWCRLWHLNIYRTWFTNIRPKQKSLLLFPLTWPHHCINRGLSWSWSYGSLIYDYLCNLCLSPLKLWVRIPLRRGVLVLDTTLCDKVCQWLATGRLFFQGTAVSSANKTDRHDITKKLLKVTLNTKITLLDC